MSDTTHFLSDAIDARLFIDQLRAAIHRLSERGVRIRPSSRMDHTLRVLQSSVGSWSRTAESLHAHLDAKQLVDISSFCLERNDPEFDAKLALLAKDPMIPTSDGERVGRDTQFELFVAAQLAAGGAIPRALEPDIVSRIKTSEVGFAVKRVKPGSQLKRRLSEARDQIVRAGSHTSHGMIVVDISLAANESGLPSIEQDRSWQGNGAEDLVSAYAEKVIAHLSEWSVARSNHPILLGVLLHAATVTAHAGSETVGMSSAIRSLGIDSSLEPLRKRIQTIFRSGWSRPKLARDAVSIRPKVGTRSSYFQPLGATRGGPGGRGAGRGGNSEESEREQRAGVQGRIGMLTPLVRPKLLGAEKPESRCQYCA